MLHFIRSYPRAFLACFSAGLFSFYNLFQLSAFNSISINLITEFQLTSFQLGLFSAIYLAANTFWLLPGGIMLDKYSLRKVVLLTMTLDIAASLIIASSYWLTLSLCMRFIQGLASAMSLLTSMRLATHWYPTSPATAVGIVVAFALTGGIAANSFFPIMINAVGWRNALTISSAIGVIFILVMWLFLDERQFKNNFSGKDCELSIKSLKKIANKQNTIYGLYVGLMNLPVFIFATLWGALYLTSVRRFSSTTASITCSLVFLGVIIGGPILGYISDKLQNRKTPMLFGAMLALLCSISILTIHHLAAWMLALLFLALGIFSSTQVIAYAAIKEVNVSYMTSTATSYISFLANTIGAFSQPLFGYLLQVNLTISAKQDWGSVKIIHSTQALLIMPAAFLLCCLLSLFIKSVKQVD